MSSETPDQPSRPLWARVGDEDANPAPASAAPIPQPIDADDTDADILRPVAAPSSEETFPTAHGISGMPVTPYGWGAGPSGAEDDDDEPAPITDPFQALAHSAVTNATLSAAGAHTPMGGVPLPQGTFLPTTVPPVPPVQARVVIDNEGPAFVPAFEARTTVPPAVAPTVSFTSVTPVAEPGDGRLAPPHHASDRHSSHPWWRSVAALVVLGVLVMAGVGYGIYALFVAAKPVELAAGVLIEGPPDNGIDPVELIEPTAFLAGAPTRTPTHTLTAVQSYQLGELEVLPGRVAEVHDLTYFDGVTTYVLRAYQHFNAADAEATFVVVTGGASGLSPVTSFGEQVGDKVELATDNGTVIVWRNGSAVFELTGPEEGLEEFFTLFGW